MENKVSVTISEAASTAITAAIATINQNLPILINLTPDERQALPKMGDKTVAFVNKSFDYANLNPRVVPTFLDMAEFGKDVNAVNALRKVLIPLTQLFEKLDDTTLEAGSEALTAALIFYNAVKGAARAGEPGMKTVYDDLKVRFPAHPKTTTAETEASK